MEQYWFGKTKLQMDLQKIATELKKIMEFLLTD